MALAEFIYRAEVVHLLGPPHTSKSRLATALAVEAGQGRAQLAFSAFADIITSLTKAEKGRDVARAHLCRASVLVVDDIRYLHVGSAGGILFFQLVKPRYERDAQILVSNRASPKEARFLVISPSHGVTRQAVAAPRRH